MARVTISDELRGLVLIDLNRLRENDDKHKGILNVKKGKLPGQIVYVMPDMDIYCTLSEDEEFVYREFQSGECYKIEKKELFSNLKPMSSL